MGMTIISSSKTDISVHQADLTDLDTAARLFDGYRQFYGQPSDIDAAATFLSERLRHHESVIFLARVSGQAIGFAQLYPAFSSVSMARTFILNDLYVCPEARGQGAARRLLQTVEAFAASVGAIRVTLSTATSNEQAQALYESAGWKRDEQFHVYHRAIHG